MSAERVTVVLSGGGAKAAAHLGAVTAAVEAGLRPAAWVGTSMGAVLAAALASGLGPDEVLPRMTEALMEDIVTRNRWAPLQGLWARSLLRPEPLRRAIGHLIDARSFAELRMPLRVTVVDLDTGELLVYGHGALDAPLVDVLVASCALPLYYPPVELDGRRLADGGLRGVLPLRAVEPAGTDLVFAVDIGPGFDEGAPERPVALPPVVRTHDDATGILMAALTQAELDRWRLLPGAPPLVYVRPETGRGDTFRLDRVPAYSGYGYRAATEALARWRAGEAATGP